MFRPGDIWSPAAHAAAGKSVLPAHISLIAVQPEPWTHEAQRARCGAVLLCFVPGAPGQPAEVILIRRSILVKAHPGQVSLPGGRVEEGDESPLHTALRETGEEIGLEPGRIIPVGVLQPIRSLDGGVIVPVVGTAAVRMDELKPDPAEVQYVFSLPWTLLMRSHAVPFGFTLFGQHRRSLVFDTPRDRVWGLTAQILESADLS